MVVRYREKTTLPSNCRATFCGKFNVHLHRVGWFAAKCGVKERIAAPMTRDHPGLGAGSEGLAVPVGGKAGSSRLLWCTSDVWRTSDVVRPRHCQRKLHHFREKQPFMMDFSSSGFTNQRALRRVIGAIAVSGVIA